MHALLFECCLKTTQPRFISIWRPKLPTNRIEDTPDILGRSTISGQWATVVNRVASIELYADRHSRSLRSFSLKLCMEAWHTHTSDQVSRSPSLHQRQPCS